MESPFSVIYSVVTSCGIEGKKSVIKNVPPTTKIAVRKNRNKFLFNNFLRKKYYNNNDKTRLCFLQGYFVSYVVFYEKKSKMQKLHFAFGILFESKISLLLYISKIYRLVLRLVHHQAKVHHKILRLNYFRILNIVYHLYSTIYQ